MSTKISISGLDDLISQLSAVEQRSLSRDMLKAAEPYLQRAMDSEMAAHPGPTADSLRSTGPKKSGGKGDGYYVAYRATDTGEKPQDGERTPTEKMFYLMQRQYIRTRRGKALQRPYVIPAYPVAAAAIAASEGQITEVMEKVFAKRIEEAWGK